MASDYRCEKCDKNYPLPPATVCVPCLNHKQEKGEDEGKGKVQDNHPLTAIPAPTPSCGSDDEGPQLYRLEQAYREGLLEPVDVQLGPMPVTARHVMKGIAKHMQRLMGLRWAVGNFEPLPYACSMAVREGITNDPAAASRAITELVQAGVIEYAGSLKPRPPRTGTKTYSPPAATANVHALRAA